MKLTAGNDNFEMAPPGTHEARCIMVCDLGVQPSDMYGDKPQLRIAWELVNERKSDGKPFIVGKTFTATLHKKGNLRPVLEAWRGRPFTEQELEGFDPSVLVGLPCYVATAQDRSAGGKDYVKITAVMGAPKGANIPRAESDSISFSLEDPHNLDVLPDWIKEKLDKRVRTEQRPVGQPSRPTPAPAAPARTMAPAAQRALSTGRAQPPPPAQQDFDDDIPF